MIIINPLYDKAFKFLMQNEKMAKLVLSTILGQEVVDVHMQPQEVTVNMHAENRGLSVFRLDFKATVRTDDGDTQLILIELQKSRFPTDIQRFRNYLAANYSRSIDDETPQFSYFVEEPAPKYGKPTFLIVTIYILGYNIEDLPYMAVSVGRKITNAVTSEELEVKSKFIEYLTHRSYILQVKRLPEHRKTKLEHFMTLFNQQWTIKNGTLIDLREIPEGFDEMIKYLQKPALDSQFIRQLEFEQEIEFILSEKEAELFEAKKKAEEEKKQAEEEKRQAEEEKKQAEEEKRQAEEEKKQAEEEKKTAQKQLKQQTKNMIKLLHKSGMSLQEIAKQTNLSMEDIEKYGIRF